MSKESCALRLGTVVYTYNPSTQGDRGLSGQDPIQAKLPGCEMPKESFKRKESNLTKESINKSNLCKCNAFWGWIPSQTSRIWQL